MGFFDNIGKSIKSAFDKTVSTIGGVFKDGKISHALGKVADTVKGVASTIHQDARDLVSGAGNIIKQPFEISKKALDKGADVIKGIGDNVEGAASSLGIPLAIGAGIVGLVLLNK